MKSWFQAIWRGAASLASGGSPRRSGSAPDNALSAGLSLPERITERFAALTGSGPESGPRPERRAGVAGLQGNLGQTPLHDLLQYLALGRKSGILELVSGRRAGRMILKEGKVCKNSYRGKEGMDAMFLMMDLTQGDFEFYEQVLEEAPPSDGLEVVDIIMLWMDRKPKKKA